MNVARTVLERQRAVDDAKLKSVEDKYTSVKTLYIGVEVKPPFLFHFDFRFFSIFRFSISIFVSNYLCIITEKDARNDVRDGIPSIIVNLYFSVYSKLLVIVCPS